MSMPVNNFFTMIRFWEWWSIYMTNACLPTDGECRTNSRREHIEQVKMQLKMFPYGGYAMRIYSYFYSAHCNSRRPWCSTRHQSSNKLATNFQMLVEQCPYSSQQIEYPELEEEKISKGVSSVRTGGQMKLRLEKVTYTEFFCGYCAWEDHNKLTCPKLKSHCTVCVLKGQNFIT